MKRLKLNPNGKKNQKIKKKYAPKPTTFVMKKISNCQYENKSAKCKYKI
jgi:tRNA A37 threonylcarbamoyladenosine synthetase subunit TsaC/SUA5/YrdC